MIHGVVNADREAIIRLLVRGPTGLQQRIKAVVDTGFDGWLSLPPALIAALRLPWLRRGHAVLANGRVTVFNIHEGTVIWDRRRRLIHVDEADTAPLVGMALLEGYELRVQVRRRGTVAIQALP
jgi:clan AA aspartic protease